MPDLVLESQRALRRPQRIGFDSDNAVSEMKVMGSVLAIAKANIENQVPLHTIHAILPVSMFTRRSYVRGTTGSSRIFAPNCE